MSGIPHVRSKGLSFVTKAGSKAVTRARNSTCRQERSGAWGLRLRSICLRVGPMVYDFMTIASFSGIPVTIGRAAPGLYSEWRERSQLSSARLGMEVVGAEQRRLVPSCKQEMHQSVFRTRVLIHATSKHPQSSPVQAFGDLLYRSRRSRFRISPETCLLPVPAAELVAVCLAGPRTTRDAMELSDAGPSNRTKTLTANLHYWLFSVIW